MALPTAYLTSTKRLPDILDALKTAKAPDKFTQSFLESLEFKSKGDRLIIGVLKGLKFIDDGGSPLERYYQFIDQSQSDSVLAEALEDAYADLFAVNTSAYELSKQDVVGKLKTLSQGKYSDVVLGNMAATFLALASLADFKSPRNKHNASNEASASDAEQSNGAPNTVFPDAQKNVKLGGLVYNIQIVLPETRDPKVYDALFRSLKEHIL